MNDLEDFEPYTPGYDKAIYAMEAQDLTDDLNGYVHSIESMTAVDGQGIRYIVFLQGCNLRCLYCCNPDSWKYGASSKQTVSEVIRGLKRALPYIKASDGGGITIGGGDPLTQPNFCAALCKAARELGVTAAVETAGHSKDRTAWDIVVPHCDFVILCAKAFTADVFKKLTKGGSLAKMIEFAEFCVEKGVPIWLTYVVLPGYTDSDAEIEGLCQFLQREDMQHGVSRVEILPYHTLGKYKFAELGLKYPLEGVERPSSELLNSIVERVRKVHSNVYL
ncbi:hypothetical protein P9112_012761 [Eukaryota sp. TZLM1-RC]